MILDTTRSPGRAAPTDVWAVTDEGFPREGTAADVWRFLLRYAILAPSSHNTQPWLFALHGDTLDLYVDWTSALPVVDPEYRELTISCGAALLHLRVALRHFGYAGDIEAFPSAGTSDLLARLELGAFSTPRAEDERLFAAIPHRRTYRRRFDERPVPPAEIAALCAAVHEEGAWLHIVEGDAARLRLAELVAEADRCQWADHRFRRELAAWVHPNRSRRHEGMPGYAHGLGDDTSYAGPLVMRTFDWGDSQAARDHQIAQGSPVLAVLGTPAAEDAPPAWLSAGQALGRLLLEACAHELFVSFLNQPIEVPELRPAVATLTGRPAYPQLVLRLGYGHQIPPTPRRPVEMVLV
jgi:hypothetical protein